MDLKVENAEKLEISLDTPSGYVLISVTLGQY